MQPNFTLKSLWAFKWMKVPLFSLLFLFLVGTINAQSYTNGNLSTGVTHAGAGTTAPAGFTWSELQGTNAGLGNGANITAGYSLADNFIVPAGPSWNITKITFFAYSTGYAGTVSPFVDTRVQIFNTDPSVGSPSPIFGDLTVNRFLSSTTALMYRTGGASGDITRQIWKIEATVNTTLSPGTYWVEWAHGNGGLSNFTPSSTVVGSTTQAGNNSKQRNFSGGQPGTWSDITDAGGPQDQHFIINYTTGPCAGTPNPGNTMPQTSAVCPSIPFTLTLANATSGSGVTYQWQSSPDGTTWTNITGATSSAYTSTLTATTMYRCNVTCSGNTGTSAPATVTLNPPSACYCTPGPTTCTLGDEILNVTMGSLNNTTSGCSGAGFTYYSALAAPQVFLGASNPISVRVNNGGTEYVSVWIDYNQNGQFEASEYTLLGSGNNVAINGSVVVPANALAGQTRMRVRVRWNSALTGGQACLGGPPTIYGETEDYNVNLVPCVPVTITSAPASASVTCGNNASFTVGATGSLPTYGWQYRTTATGIWQTVTNGGIYSGATTATLSLTNVTQPLSGYQYRALVAGACSGVDFSGTATLTVNPLVATVTKTPAGNICLGSIQKLSITNTTPVSKLVVSSNAALNITIPDNGTTVGVNNSLTVAGIPAGVLITSIKVKANVTHSWAGDMVIVVKAPNGNILNLAYALNGTGGAGPTTAMRPTFSSTLTPAKYLDAGADPFDAEFSADGYNPTTGDPTVPTGPNGYIPTSTSATRNNFTNLYSVANNANTLNGNWTIAMYDYYQDDATTNKFNNWSLEIEYSGGLANGVWRSTVPNNLFTDAAATIPYDGVTPMNTVYTKPATAGTFNDTVTVNNGLCTSVATVVPVTVIAPASAVVNPVNKGACIGGNATFTTSASGGPLTYQWQLSTDGGTTWTDIAGATSASYTVTGATSSMNNYRYRANIMAAPCAGTVSTSAALLTVFPTPTLTISAPDVALAPTQTTVVTASPSPAGATYVWTLNGASIAGTGNTQAVNVDQLGTYQAAITDANGCKATSNELVIGAEASDRLWIYPNPTKGNFQVRLYYDSDVAEKRVVYIYNNIGELITSREISLVDNTPPYVAMNFDLSNFAKGIYVIKVAHRFTGKVVSGLVVVQ